MDYTKKELVEMINALPGPMVTTRPRKDTLLEILAERQEDAEAYMHEIHIKDLPMPMPMPEMPSLTLWQKFVKLFTG